MQVRLVLTAILAAAFAGCTEASPAEAPTEEAPPYVRPLAGICPATEPSQFRSGWPEAVEILQPSGRDAPAWEATLDARIDKSSTLCLSAMAQNVGRESLQVVRKMCYHDPMPLGLERLQDGDWVEVLTEEPGDSCQPAAECRPWRQGDQVELHQPWDGGVWDDGAASMVAAPAGEYRLVVSFTPYAEDQCRPLGPQASVTLAFIIR